MKTCVECWFYGMGDGTCLNPMSPMYGKEVEIDYVCEEFATEKGKEGSEI